MSSPQKQEENTTSAAVSIATVESKAQEVAKPTDEQTKSVEAVSPSQKAKASESIVAPEESKESATADDKDQDEEDKNDEEEGKEGDAVNKKTKRNRKSRKKKAAAAAAASALFAKLDFSIDAFVPSASTLVELEKKQGQAVGSGAIAAANTSSTKQEEAGKGEQMPSVPALGAAVKPASTSDQNTNAGQETTGTTEQQKTSKRSNRRKKANAAKTEQDQSQQQTTSDVAQAQDQTTKAGTGVAPKTTVEDAKKEANADEETKEQTEGAEGNTVAKKKRRKNKKSKQGEAVELNLNSQEFKFNIDAPVFAPIIEKIEQEGEEGKSKDLSQADKKEASAESTSKDIKYADEVKPATESSQTATEKPITQLPISTSSDQKQGQNQADQTAPVDDFGGYMNPHVNQVSSSANQQQAEEDAKKVELEKRHKEEEKRVYSIEFMMSLRMANRARPVNMALLDFPHKKRKSDFQRKGGVNVGLDVRADVINEIDKFNSSVGEMRTLLNKLSDSNYEKIENQIMNNFEYTPSLLYELMKIIFMKATTEQVYMEVYVRLCVTLFKKFNDRENVEMNFRKLLLTRCEKQFYKMLKREQEDRRSRRASMEEAQLMAGTSKADPRKNAGVNETGVDNDYNKKMLAIFDVSEIKKREKDQMFGNMALIVELYKYDLIKADIIITCINELYEEINEQNIEIVTQMLKKLASHVVKSSRKAREGVAAASGDKAPAKTQTKSSRSLISLDWIDQKLQNLFASRHDKSLDSRLRFQIQDLMDQYDKDWKYEIYKNRNVKIDSDGYQQKYVPKTALLSPENTGKSGASSGKQSRSRKNSSVHRGAGDDKQYKMMYQPKKMSSPKNSDSKGKKLAEGGPGGAPNAASIYQLLSNLKPEGNDKKKSESHSDDEDAMKIVDRKISLNQVNVTGLNFEKYQELKPSNELRRKITNLCQEFINLHDKKHASEEFVDIMKETGLKSFIFVGYVLNNALSSDPQGWSEISSLVIDHFWKEEHLFEGVDLLEGVNVSLSNFLDTLIDYPNSKDYANQLLKRLHSEELINQEQFDSYVKHIENLENMDYLSD